MIKRLRLPDPFCSDSESLKVRFIMDTNSFSQNYFVKHIHRRTSSSLELLTYLIDQRGELVLQANGIMRSFMAQIKIDAFK